MAQNAAVRFDTKASSHLKHPPSNHRSHSAQVASSLPSLTARLNPVVVSLHSDLDHFAHIFSTFEQRAAQDIRLERQMSSGNDGDSREGHGSSGGYGGYGGRAPGHSGSEGPPVGQDDFAAFLRSLEPHPHSEYPAQIFNQVSHSSVVGQPSWFPHHQSPSYPLTGSTHTHPPTSVPPYTYPQSQSLPSSAGYLHTAGASLSTAPWPPQLPTGSPNPPLPASYAAAGPSNASVQDMQSNLQLQMMYLQWQQQQLQAALSMGGGSNMSAQYVPPASASRSTHVFPSLPSSSSSPPARHSATPSVRANARSNSSQMSSGGEGDETGPSAEEKRKKNTEASARFRVKKKERVQGLGRTISELEGRAQDLEREASSLRTENDWLKEMVILKGRNTLMAQSGNRQLAAPAEQEDEEDVPRQQKQKQSGSGPSSK